MTDTSAGGAAGRASLILTFDIDNLRIGAEVTGLSSPLQELIATLPPGTQAFLAWVPDLDLAQASTFLDLDSGALGAYVEVSDGGTELASAYVSIVPVSGDTQAA